MGDELSASACHPSAAWMGAQHRFLQVPPRYLLDIFRALVRTTRHARPKRGLAQVSVGSGLTVTPVVVAEPAVPVAASHEVSGNRKRAEGTMLDEARRLHHVWRARRIISRAIGVRCSHWPTSTSKWAKSADRHQGNGPFWFARISDKKTERLGRPPGTSGGPTSGKFC